MNELKARRITVYEWLDKVLVYRLADALWRRPTIASAFEQCTVVYLKRGVLIAETPTMHDYHALERAKPVIVDIALAKCPKLRKIVFVPPEEL